MPRVQLVYHSFCRFLIVLLALVGGVAASFNASAHAPGEHYIWLAVDEAGLHGKVEINVAELNKLSGISLDPQAPLTDSTIGPYQSIIKAYVETRFGITARGKTLEIELTGVKARSFEEGNYAQVDFRAATDPAAARDLVVRDEMLFETGRTHRGILLTTVDTAGKENPEGNFALVFNANNTSQPLNIDEPAGLLTNLQFIWQGALHIWFGFDHVLFLLSLLLTTVLVRQAGGWRPATSFRSVFFSVLKIVTVFTLAHSVTLMLAGLDYVDSNFMLPTIIQTRKHIGTDFPLFLPASTPSYTPPPPPPPPSPSSPFHLLSAKKNHYSR